MSEPTSLAAPPEPRSPWQRLYAAAHGARRRWYASHARALPRPVLSVGNLHWGGSGKTPLVAAIAARVRDSQLGLGGLGPGALGRGGLRVAILSRGYAGRGKGTRLVSTWERGPLLSPGEAGDEPVLLARSLPGVAVVVGADRHRAGLAALTELAPPPDLFLLDDGFSHLRLERNLDLLAFPAADPFAGGRLPPSGRLREPLSASARAGAALLTGAGVGPGEAAELGRVLARFGFAGPAFAAPARFGPPRLVQGGPAGALPAGAPLRAGARVLLASGIARPAAFRAAAEGMSLVVAGELAFPDHHAFPEASRERIEAAFAASGADAVLVTEKDAVKLAPAPVARAAQPGERALSVPLAELPMALDPEPAFWAWLEARLAAILAPWGATEVGR